MSLSSSEKIKSLKTVNDIYNKLHKENFGKDTIIIVIGGGVLGDVAGFVASTYMRGVALLHVPTTLIAVIDSSIGGKTAVNLNKTKNLIGTIYQPNYVLIDTKFLETLSQKEVVSGFGELIKYSYMNKLLYLNVLLSDKFYDDKLISECIKIKANIVSEDENESLGKRKELNFGHTFAHAFESNSKFKLSHGQAVIIGIISALYLSFKKKLINKKQLNEMLKLPLKLKQHIKMPDFDEEELYTTMSYDKKNRDNKINFVLIRDFGQLLIDVNAKKSEVFWSLKQTKEVMK
jgi:3-dehydroquinate synthase